MTQKTQLSKVPSYITKDGSLIRELMHPAQHGNSCQSLAEATVAPGCVTARHRHHATEELYHVMAGSGIMHLGEVRLALAPGDTVHIAPGVWHFLSNTGAEPLRVLCCCSPAYSHDDTELEG